MSPLASGLSRYSSRLMLVATTWLVLASLWNSGLVEDGPILCWFRALTGHPCPFCGSTRAVSALCAGDVSAAWSLNPLGTIAFVILALFFVVPAPMQQGVNRLRSALPPMPQWVMVSAIGALFFATWAWNISTRW